MNVWIFWIWYVGLVTWLAFSKLWHNVLCCDTNIEKVKLLNNGKSPMYEPWIDTLIQEQFQKWQIRFTSSDRETVVFGDVIISAVWTPTLENWDSNLEYLENVCKSFWKYINNFKLFINKSTSPVGTLYRCRNMIEEEIKNRWEQFDFDIASNPEFLRQWSAINDFLIPERIVYWTDSKPSLKIMRELYKSLIKDKIPIIETDIKTSELIKYVSNAFLSLKLTFINDIANLWEKLRINIDDLVTWVGLDNRIWKSYMNPWIGYWWSCLSKDNLSFINFSKNVGHNLLLIKDVEKINEDQKVIIVKKLINLVWSIEGKTISIWWLSFKENTDDIRYAPSIDIIKILLLNWVWKINLFDPKANDNVKNIFSKNDKLIFIDNKYDALENTDALLLLTWWDEFNNLDLQFMKQKMRWNIILDWRNFLNKQQIIESGFIYGWIWK